MDIYRKWVYFGLVIQDNIKQDMNQRYTQKQE